MEITFKTGKTVSYAAVSQDVWSDFKTAPSQGKFFHAHIKGRFDGVDITEKPKEV
jgi:hypothetical protein